MTPVRPHRVPELALGLALVVALVAVGWLFATDERVRPLSWETAERVDGGRAVSLTFLVNPCQTYERTDVEVDDDRIVLTVLVREQGGTCRDIGYLETARAALPAVVPTSAQLVDGAG